MLFSSVTLLSNNNDYSIPQIIEHEANAVQEPGLFHAWYSVALFHSLQSSFKYAMTLEGR